MELRRIDSEKKGQLGDAQNVLIGLVILAMLGGVGALVLDGFADDIAECSAGLDFNESSNQCENSTTSEDPVNAGFNTTTDGLTGISNMSSQFSTVGTIGIASVLLSLVLGAFAFGRSRR